MLPKSHISAADFNYSQTSYNSHLSETTFNIVCFLPGMHWPLTLKSYRRLIWGQNIYNDQYRLPLSGCCVEG